MSDDRRQIRVRIPADLLRELEVPGTTLNDQIVQQLRLASLSRSAMRENALIRALACCFVSAEVVTGKSVERDKQTLKLALDMTIKLVSHFDSQVKAKGRPDVAEKIVAKLLSLAEPRDGFFDGLSVAAP